MKNVYKNENLIKGVDCGMLKIVPTVDYCGGCEYENSFKRYYEIHNVNDYYEYQPTFTNLDEAIAYIYDRGQTEIIIDMNEWCYGSFYKEV